MATHVKHRKGLIATVVFHGIILSLMLFMAFRTPLPLPAEQGILVDFGNSLQGFGNFEPRMSDVAYMQQQQSSSTTQSEQQALTQEYEETVALSASPNERSRETASGDTSRDTSREATSSAEQTATVERAPDPRAMFPGRGDASSTATSQGEAGGQGNQGVPTGAPNVHVYGEGIDVGGGIAGRGIAGSLPRPSYNVNDHGVVVVEVRVDRDGNVTSARAGVRGTTTSNSTLHEAARRAAMQTKFARSNVLEQTGTITYTFRLQGE